MNTVVRTFEIPVELADAVERLAKETRRTPSEVVSEAVEQLVTDIDDVAIDLERWAEYERTGEAIDLEEMRGQLEAIKQRRRKTPG
jgi:predicted transcriptional regulator